MFKQEYIIKNPSGLHARPASQLIAYCKNISEDIILRNNTFEVNPKSIVSVLAGGLKNGTAITVEVSGDNETKVGEDLIVFLDSLKD